jgi:hypothetical protein
MIFIYRVLLVKEAKNHEGKKDIFYKQPPVPDPAVFQCSRKPYRKLF